ncbi:hypothetical protein [Pseudorhodobacter ferrugineus]|uniref:hypothetical protein n=1 Tax=Pseudorhodobacter ferrugineus TaxID=77008 RepID=UPI000B0CEEE0|nr:hypothetical protein [Pseudorhodobacter ferrugineus]
MLDTSDPRTFDDELLVALRDNHTLIRDYLNRDREIFQTYDNYNGPGRPLFRPDNPHWNPFQAFRERLDPLMESRVIRGFHYTRMTDAELEIMRTGGIRLSTPSFLEARLAALVSADLLTIDEVGTILDQSAFKTQLGIRPNMFWMVSSRLPMDDTGVKPLLAAWGGEVASMHLTDHDLLTKLQSIGRPRMIEVAAPLSATNQIHTATCAVVAAYALQNGWPSEEGLFDFYVKNDLPSDALLHVVTQDNAG